jgi:hypothetical protein
MPAAEVRVLIAEGEETDALVAHEGDEPIELAGVYQLTAACN